jgi:hypothetical protein
MSIQVIARVLPKRWGSPSRKIVALKLADVAREDGSKIYPSIATVAAEAELSERQVQRVMDEFRKEGLLVITRKGGGRYKTTEYRLDMTAIECLPNARPMPEGEIISLVGKGDMVSPFAKGVTAPSINQELRKGDTQSQKGDMVSPNPSLPLSTLSSKEASASHEAGAGTPKEGFEEEKSPIAVTPAIGGQPPIGEIKLGMPTLPPSTNSMVWKEGWELLKATSSKPNRSIIVKWLERASIKKDGKEKLLGMIRAAVKAGTLDPEGYIFAALRDEFGPLPQPKKFDAATWQRNVQAAIKTKDWPQAWGPPPGKKGCLVPDELITAELIAALAGWRAAA